MTSTLALAAGAHSAGGIPSPITILLVVAGIGYVLWSRTQGRPLRARRLLVLPLLFIVIGLADLTSSTAPHLRAAAIAFLVAGAVISVLLGAARGTTIELYPKDGELWQRYRRSTVMLWIALIAAKIILTVIAHGAGGAAGAGTNSLLLAFGLSLLAEAVVIAPRALSTGLPFATGQARREDRRSPRAQPREPRNEDLAGATAPLGRVHQLPGGRPSGYAAASETTAQSLADALTQHHESHRARNRERHDNRHRH